MTTVDRNVNDYILKEMRVGYWCIMVCSCVFTVCVFLWVCIFVCRQSIIKYLSVPAGLSHCMVLLFFVLSLSIRIHFKHLTGDFSCGGMGLFRFWSHFVSHLILMNWLHKALRQHTLSSVINAQIHSFLFIWGGVWSFPTAEQMSPGSLGKLSSKPVSFPWCLTHANWPHLKRLSAKT